MKAACEVAGGTVLGAENSESSTSKLDVSDGLLTSGMYGGVTE